MLWDEWKTCARDDSLWVNSDEKGLLKAKHMYDYVLRLWFEEGSSFSVYELDCKPLIVDEDPGPALLPLRDIKRFRTVKGNYTLTWPDSSDGRSDETSIDIAPECVRFFCQRYGTLLTARRAVDMSKEIGSISESEICTTSPRFPSREEWRRILLSYPLARIDVQNRAFYQPEGDGSLHSRWIQTFVDIEAKEWIEHLYSRLDDVQYGFVMMTFYFQQYSQAENTSRQKTDVERRENRNLFHAFDRHRSYEKLYFDRYSQLFYLSMFSAFENIGHIINVLYSLQIGKIVFDEDKQKQKRKGRVSFVDVVKKLKNEFPHLHKQMLELKEREAFKLFQKIRNDMSHNFLPRRVGGSITHELDKENRNVEIAALGSGQYTSAEELHTTALDMLSILAEALFLISLEA